MDDINKQKPEVPIIIIERDEQPQTTSSVTRVVDLSWKRKWMKRLLALLAVGCLMVAVLVGYYFWNYYYNIGVPVSVTPEQNIKKLQQHVKQETPEVVMTSDSILGVAMDFYAIHGLKASIEFEEPDTADTSVYLYCRSADHTADGDYLGSLVAEGVERQSDRSRLGYMSMADGNMVIGISRSEKVKDYVLERGGSLSVTALFQAASIFTERWSVAPLAASATNSTSSPPATKKPFGTLPTPSVNTTSSMPSTLLVEQIMFSIAVGMVLGMTSVILLIIRMKSGRGSFRGWYLGSKRCR